MPPSKRPEGSAKGDSPWADEPQGEGEDASLRGGSARESPAAREPVDATAPELPAQGREKVAPERARFDASTPRFARGYPQDPALDRLVLAFSRGNHAIVRREAPELQRRTTDPAVAAAARDLRRRLEPDPLAYVLLGTTALLLVALFAWALHQSRALDRSRPAIATPAASSSASASASASASPR